MTTFKQVFLELFDQRNRYIKWFLLAQAFVVVFFSLFVIVFHCGQSLLNIDEAKGWTIPYELTINTTTLFDIVFLGLTIFRNEKLQVSQTWRLIPLSDTKLFLTNIISTISNCIVIFIPQILVITFLNGMTSLDRENNFWKGASFFWSSNGNIEGLKICFYLLAIVLLIVTFISFTNFSSELISTFLPMKSKKVGRWILMAIIIIVGTYLAINIYKILGTYWNRAEIQFLNSSMTQANINKINMIEFVYPVLIILSSGIVLGGADVWLINKVEAKANK